MTRSEFNPKIHRTNSCHNLVHRVSHVKTFLVKETHLLKLRNAMIEKFHRRIQLAIRIITFHKHSLFFIGQLLRFVVAAEPLVNK